LIKDINELEVYSLAMDFGEIVWETVSHWDHFSRQTIGVQLINACDSISANISEGFGRFHFNENKHFCYYARGSLFETKTWLIKSYKRGLIDTALYSELMEKTSTIGKRLNNYIRSIGTIRNPITGDNAK